MDRCYKKEAIKKVGIQKKEGFTGSISHGMGNNKFTSLNGDILEGNKGENIESQAERFHN